jgi:HSP20 family protein
MNTTTSHNSPVRVPDARLESRRDDHVLELDVPGVPKDGVELTFENGLLAVHCRRSAVESDWTSVHQEISSGDYRRLFELDRTIDASRISASLDQGILRIVLPKVEEAKPHRISLN